MSAAFTPGPWSIGPAHVVRQQTVDEQGRRVTRFVAEAVLSAPFIEGEREANARLIATAPRMYAALEDCILALDPCPQRNEAIATLAKVQS